MPLYLNQLINAVSMNAFFQIRRHAKLIVTALTLSVSIPLVAIGQTSPLADKKLEKIQLFAESAKMNSATTEITADDRMKTGKGASLKANVATTTSGKNKNTKKAMTYTVVLTRNQAGRGKEAIMSGSSLHQIVGP